MFYYLYYMDREFGLMHVRLADNLAKKNWPRILDAFVRRANPHLSGLLKGMRYYWVTDQCETAVDIMFRSRQALSVVDDPAEEA